MSSLEGVVIVAAFGAGTVPATLAGDGVVITSTGDERAALTGTWITDQLTAGQQNRGTTTDMALKKPLHQYSPAPTELRRSAA